MIMHLPGFRVSPQDRAGGRVERARGLGIDEALRRKYRDRARQ